MPGQPAGGIPVTKLYAVVAAGSGEGERSTPGETTRLRVRSDAAVRLYWNEADFTNNVNYITVDTSTDNAGEFHMAVQVRRFWLRSPVGTANVEVTFILK